MEYHDLKRTKNIAIKKQRQKILLQAYQTPDNTCCHYYIIGAYIQYMEESTKILQNPWDV